MYLFPTKKFLGFHTNTEKLFSIQNNTTGKKKNKTPIWSMLQGIAVSTKLT